ncbi:MULTISPECIES: hypothetical protein [Tenebrionibacter/Tenebrionicola group]|uniref:Uncharacterized protein n=2 Tax=Tenebrionibacter/Tenebrionicola group TaxID=2969848 RepID=A0A8K0V6R9_9ENTR|nr:MULTISPECIES: hypothetical protein [Tenebrionibacter/Tenebrionicola group]MBK4715227.1 hypothetical protein [Tenebrionibacter intestinalis]MBV5094180.1 hypothetical protein [Tenebrionicola larvae]
MKPDDKEGFINGERVKRAVCRRLQTATQPLLRSALAFGHCCDRPAVLSRFASACLRFANFSGRQPHAVSPYVLKASRDADLNNK